MYIYTILKYKDGGDEYCDCLVLADKEKYAKTGVFSLSVLPTSLEEGLEDKLEIYDSSVHECCFQLDDPYGYTEENIKAFLEESEFDFEENIMLVDHMLYNPKLLFCIKGGCIYITYKDEFDTHNRQSDKYLERDEEVLIKLTGYGRDTEGVWELPGGKIEEVKKGLIATERFEYSDLFETFI